MIYICSLSEENNTVHEGKILLQTIEELYKVILQAQTREITIKDEFIEKYFTVAGFRSFVKECKRINRFLEIIYNPEYSCFDAANTFDEAGRAQAVSENSKLINMRLELLELKSLLEQERREHRITCNKLAKAVSELDAMVSSINHRYGRAIDTEKYSGIRVSANKYSKILYIKEITRVRYVDTFIDYLQEIIKTVYLKQTKLVVIEPLYSDSRVGLYPKCKCYSTINNINVTNQDIFMAGFQVNLMEDILRNPFNADYLIVLDRSGYQDAFISGNDVEIIYTVSDIEDIGFNIMFEHIISYDFRTLNIPLIEAFNQMNSSDRINNYYEMQITRTVIRLIEEKY